MRQWITIELEADKKINLEKIEEPLAKVLEAHGAKVRFVTRANPVPENEPDLCDECGVEYPEDAPSLMGLFHKEECSLYGDPYAK